MYLKAHHIFCLLQFQGKGYDDEFIKNLKYVYNNFKTTDITIVKNGDDICKKCPNLSNNNTCLNDNSSVLKLDNNVLNALNLQIGDMITFDEIKTYFLKNVTEDIFKNICCECSWYQKNVCKYENFFKHF